jgi:photosystem II stability/assembly factor-like uncharacterized protein
VGPAGGDVRSLSNDPREPGIFYLGTANGILYKSEDAGGRWRRLEPGFPTRGKSLDNLIVDPRGRILVGYWEVGGTSGGVARSSDDGRSFALLPGIEGHSVRGLAIAPSNPDVIVASAIDGVFRSDDGGDSWRRISPAGHAEIRNVESVAIDPTDPDVVYVGTWHLPWKTMDGGRTWRSTHEGMIDDSDVFVMMLDHRTPRTVYATACTGIYRSVDAGARWVKAKGIPTSSRRTRAFAQDPERPDTLYAGTTEGLFKSEDGMATWRLMTSKDLVVNSIAMLPRARGGTLILGTDGAGVLRSSDGGETWSASNEGFSERLFSRVLFDGRGGRVLAGVLGDRQHGGVFAAPRPEGPWAKLGRGLEGREVLSLDLTPSGILAGTDDGLFLSEPGGADWRRLATLAGGIDVHPRASDVLALPERIYLAATSRGLLRSADGGATWTRLSLGSGGSVLALAAAAPDRRLLMAATALGFFRSRDAGSTWEEVSPGLAGLEVHSLAFLPGDEKVLFATTPEGLLKSTDQGRVWQKRGRGLPDSDIRGLALTADGRILYASDFARGGLYRSGDAGETWREVTVSGLGSDRVWTVAVDPASPETLLAASSSGGLHLLMPPAAAGAAGRLGEAGRAQE